MEPLAVDDLACIDKGINDHVAILRTYPFQSLRDLRFGDAVVLLHDLDDLCISCHFINFFCHQPHARGQGLAIGVLLSSQGNDLFDQINLWSRFQILLLLVNETDSSGKRHWNGLPILHLRPLRFPL